MSENLRDLTPEERITALEAAISVLNDRIGGIDGLEDAIHYLRQDVNAKAGECHDHVNLERLIRDTEYHTHHEYARERHTHGRWDLQ
jgi:hypothetical protein